MSLEKKRNKKNKLRTKRRIHRVRNSQASRGLKPRVCVVRSLKHVSAQIIDDNTQTTLVSFSSLKFKEEKVGDKKAVSKKVGVELGKLALNKSIKEVFFDRGKYLYHGRIGALADGLRESGLQF